MKKLFILIAIIITVTLIPQAIAQTATPAATNAEKDEKLIEQINNLKEKVASKVAELKLVERRGVVGIVSQISGNKINLTDTTDQSRLIDVDELTEFSSPSARGTFGISDITKGSKISVVGLYNKQSKRLLARFVETVTIPVFLTGVVTEVDKANFTVSVASENQINTIVDIENVTRTSTYTDEDELTRAGFSQITIGDRVHVVGFANSSTPNRITGTRIIRFPELPDNPKISVPPGIEQEDTTPTPTGTTRRTTPAS